MAMSKGSSRFLLWWKRYARTALYAFSGMERDNVRMVASGLVYSLLVAVIPCITFLVAFLSAFGVLEPFMGMLAKIFEDMFGEETGFELMRYIRQFSSNAMSLGLIGLGSFIVSGIFLVDKIYISINQIFHIKPTSGTMRRFSTFLTFIIVFAFMIAAFLTVQSRATSFIAGLAVGRRAVGSIPRSVTAFIWLWLLLMFLYSIVPSARIRFGSSAMGATTGAIALFIASHIFQSLTHLMVSQSVIYGSMASLFITLLFLYICWYIVLYCAEMVYIYQFEPEKAVLFGHIHPPAMQISEALTIVLIIAYKHRKGEGATTVRELMKRLRVPSGVISSYLSDLANGGIILAVNPRKTAFVPYRPMDQVKVRDVIAIAYGSAGDETLGEEVAASFLGYGTAGFGNMTMNELLEKI